MTSVKWVTIILFASVLSFSSAWVNADEKYESSYDVTDYFDALMNAGLQRALEMAEEHIRQQLVSVINDPEQREKLLRKLAVKGIKWADDTLNDDGKTELEKAKAITDIVMSSFPPHDSGLSGSLNVSLRYSPEFLVTEITWDRKIEVLECSEWKVTANCYFNSYTGFRECDYSGYYERVEYTAEPEYRIFRVVNGNKILVTKVLGQFFRGDATFSTKPNEWASQIESLLSDSGNDHGAEGRMSNLDFDPDIREPDTSLKYIVEADSGAVWNRYSGSDLFCDDSSSWSSQVYFDEDADGFADFLPRSAYSSSFVNILPAVNHVLFN